MELFQLRYFVAAAHHLHFTRAAETMCVSQPSLSQQIANLERELKTPLFARHGRTVSLTDAGHALLRHAERILDEEQAARRAVQEVLGLERGQITVWTLPTPGQHLLPPRLAAFRRAHPHIQISLRETVPARAVAEAVMEGRADIGIVHRPYDVDGLCEKTLLREDLVLVVPATHPLANKTSVALPDVRDEDFVWVPEGANAGHPIYAACLSAGFVPHIVCISGSPQGIQALVAAGLGIALLPRLAIEVQSGTAIVELDAPRPTRTLAAVWRGDRLSHAAAAFLHSLSATNESSCRNNVNPEENE